MYHIYITLRYEDRDIQLHFTDVEYLVKTIKESLDKGNCIIKDVVFANNYEMDRIHIDSYELNKAIPNI